MKDDLEFKILPDGEIQTIYSPGIEQFARDIGASINIKRASNVEWDVLCEGWVVTAAHDNRLAICYKKKDGYTSFLNLCVENHTTTGNIAFFDTREEALEAEEKFFWELLPPRNTNG
jgi:hypothetical protein